MDNLFASICIPSFQQKKGHRIPWVICVNSSEYSPHQRVAGFTGIGGSFAVEAAVRLVWKIYSEPFVTCGG